MNDKARLSFNPALRSMYHPAARGTLWDHGLCLTEPVHSCRADSQPFLITEWKLLYNFPFLVSVVLRNKLPPSQKSVEGSYSGLPASVGLVFGLCAHSYASGHDLQAPHSPSPSLPLALV